MEFLPHTVQPEIQVNERSISEKINLKHIKKNTEESDNI